MRAPKAWPRFKVRLSGRHWLLVACPYKHGIVSNQVFPAGLVARDGWVSMLPTPIGTLIWETLTTPKLIDATHRKTVAIWDVLARLRFDTGLVGWPVTDPVSEESSFGFSHRYFQGYFKAPMAQPGELAERGVLFQVNPEEIDPLLLENLVDRVPYVFLQDLAEDLWRESLTMFLLDQQRETKASFIMLPGLARVSSRNFGGFAAVHFAGVQHEPYLGAAQRLTAYYRHLDQFLAALWERETGPKILAVVSAYGFEAPEGWRRLRAQVTGRRTNGLYQQAPDGLFRDAGRWHTTGRVSGRCATRRHHADPSLLVRSPHRPRPRWPGSYRRLLQLVSGSSSVDRRPVLRDALSPRGNHTVPADHSLTGPSITHRP